MLKLIMGRMGSGKTTFLYNQIKRNVEADEPVMFIVPEQYSFQTEKAMLELLGARGADKVEVVSFSFLARNTLKRYGVNTKTTIDDSARALMMSLALESVSDELTVYGRHRYSASVITEMLKMVKEFRQCAVTPSMLHDTANQLPVSLLKSKLKELALVDEAYTALVGASYFDEESALDMLCEVIAQHKDLEGKNVYIDGFRGYTAQELNVLSKILEQAKDVTITLTGDRNNGDEFGAFGHTQRTKRKLARIAKKSGVKIAPVEYLELPDDVRYGNDELNFLERNLYESKYEEYDKPTEYITLCSAENFESECEYVAHTIKRLIRTEGLRCRDFAIISRSDSGYSRQLCNALKKNGVPVFDDRRQPVANQPLIELVVSAIDIAVNGFSCDSVMRVLKTGLTDLSSDEISELENYALMWQLNGTKWLSDWTAHPDGLGEKMRDGDIIRLQRLNACRIKVAAPLQKLRTDLKECNGLSAAKAIYSLLTELNVAENLKALAEKLDLRGEKELAIQQGEMWDVVIEILDRIAFSLEKNSLTTKRFAELFNLIISMYTVGNLPQGLDEIVIGTADRVKTTAPRVVFAVGVNDGVFPMVPASAGILSQSERKILSELKLEMDDTFEQKIMEEHFIAYSTLCAPVERLFVSFVRKDNSGASMSESELVTQLKNIFPRLTAVDTATENPLDSAEGNESAFELMARLYQEGGTVYKTLEAYFEGNSEYSGKVNALKRAVDKKEFEITDKETATELFGKNMYMSASRTEVYNKCPFEYFCQYGMKANPRKVAELDPLQKGTAVHYILEHIISAYGSDALCEMTKEERDKCILKLLDDYLNENLAVGAEMGDRFNFLFGRLGFVVCEVVDRLVNEFSVSEFKPVAFELKIDDDGEVPAYDIPLSDGGVLKLKGSVDRVDVASLNDGDYVRVVDYKGTGKKFDLNEVYYGLNMQMLIYLFAIWKKGFGKYGNVKPAGVLYMPSNAPFANEERNADEKAIMKAKQKNAKMDGMVLDDSRVIYAMDSRQSGEIIPVALRKKENTYSGNLISLKQMELLVKRVEKILSEMAVSLHEGVICAKPAKAEKKNSAYNDVCKYCNYKSVCGVDDDTDVRKIEEITHSDSLLKLGGEWDA